MEFKLDQVLTIFLAGISGVFVGIGLLYIAILVTPQITRRLEAKKDNV